MTFCVGSKFGFSKSRHIVI